MAKVILYVGGFVLPDGNAAAHRALNNGKVLRSLGYNVCFIGVSKENNYRKLFDTHENISGFDTYCEPYPSSIFKWLNYLASIKNIQKIIEHFGKENIEAIIAYNYPALALLRVKSYCEKIKIRVLSDCTEWAVDFYRNPVRAILKNFDTYLRMKFIHPRLDGLIAISKYLFDYYSCKMNNVVQIPPLVDTSDEKWKGIKLVESDTIVLVYAGSPGVGSKDKIDLIIEAMSMVKPKIGRKLKLKVIGITKQQFHKVFKKEIPLNIVDDVYFKGKLTHLESIKEIQNATYSIFFRDDNIVTRAGFPTKFVESISCGTPVLTNASSNVSDYLTDNRYGFIINLKTNEELINSLIVPLSLPKEKIIEMKKFCLNTKIFDYRKYLMDFDNFLKGKMY